MLNHLNRILSYVIILGFFIFLASFTNQLIMVEWNGGIEIYQDREEIHPIWDMGYFYGLISWGIGLVLTLVYLLPIYFYFPKNILPYFLLLLISIWVPLFVFAKFAGGFFFFVQYMFASFMLVLVFWFYTKNTRNI